MRAARRALGVLIILAIVYAIGLIVTGGRPLDALMVSGLSVGAVLATGLAVGLFMLACDLLDGGDR